MTSEHGSCDVLSSVHQQQKRVANHLSVKKKMLNLSCFNLAAQWKNSVFRMMVVTDLQTLYKQADNYKNNRYLVKLQYKQYYGGLCTYLTHFLPVLAGHSETEV
jgi:hypothetical protein